MTLPVEIVTLVSSRSERDQQRPGPDPQVLALEVENFRGLQNITLSLGQLTVLIGPHGSGKTSLLDVFGFIADGVRYGIETALEQRGGFARVAFRGGETPPAGIRIQVKFASSSDESDQERKAALAEKLASLRNFRLDVAAARRPSRFPQSALADDASNLAAILLGLRTQGGEAWQRLQADAIELLPQLERIAFGYPGGTDQVEVVLYEHGLRYPTRLADASSGTVRLLALLALLHDPNPPFLTCIDNLDEGLHPQAFDLIVERLRQASERTQLLITTNSPTLVDRLKPEELVVCGRRRDGSVVIPAFPTDTLHGMVRASAGLPLGHLWLSGALTRVPGVDQ